MKIPDAQQAREKIPVLKPDWKDRMTYKIKPVKIASESSIQTACSNDNSEKVPF